MSGNEEKRDYKNLLNGHMVSVISPPEMLSSNDAGLDFQKRQMGNVTEIFSRISSLIGNALRQRIEKIN